MNLQEEIEALKRIADFHKVKESNSSSGNNSLLGTKLLTIVYNHYKVCEGAFVYSSASLALAGMDGLECTYGKGTCYFSLVPESNTRKVISFNKNTIRVVKEDTNIIPISREEVEEIAKKELV